MNDAIQIVVGIGDESQGVGPIQMWLHDEGLRIDEVSPDAVITLIAVLRDAADALETHLRRIEN